LPTLETTFEDIDRITLLPSNAEAAHAGVSHDLAGLDVLDELDRQSTRRHGLTPVMKISNQRATWLPRDHGDVCVACN
jgi:hypothetical protein